MDWFSELNGLTPTAGQSKPEATDWFGQVNGTAPAQEAQSKPAPQKGNIISRTIDAIKGKQDPAYANVPTFDDGSFSTVTSGLIGKLSGQDDKAYGDILSKSLGDRFKRRITDANGYDIIEYADDKGQTKQGYVNKPGLDSEDVSRGLFQAVPYALSGLGVGALMKGAPNILKGAAQLGAASGTSIVGDVAAMGVGSEQGVDKTKALMAGAGAGLFQALPHRATMAAIGGLGGAAYGWGQGLSEDKSTLDASKPLMYGGAGMVAGVGTSLLARRFLGMNPGTYAQGGKLTPQGEAAAKAANMSPDELIGDAADTFAKNYAMTRDAAQAAMFTDARSIPMSKAQITGARDDFVRQDQMLSGMKGRDAQEVAQQFLEVTQPRAIQREALGYLESPSVPVRPGAAPPPPTIPKGVMGQLNPTGVGLSNPAKFGSSINSNLKEVKAAADAAENAAWKKVTDLKATPEAQDLLATEVNAALKDAQISLSKEVTPQTMAMIDVLKSYKSGKSPIQADEFIPDLSGRSVDAVRRELGLLVKNAQSSDRVSAGAIYEAFNVWIGKAAEKQLMIGNPEAAAALRQAVSISREAKQIWEPMLQGKATPAANRLRDVLKDDATPEKVVSALFGDVTTRAAIPNGSVEALRAIKVGLDRYATKETSMQVMGDLKGAWWLKVVTGKNGEMATPQVIVNNIKMAKTQQGTLYNELLNASDMRAIDTFQRQMERIAYTPSKLKTNASGSGFTVGVLAKEAMEKVWQAIGLNSTLGQAALSSMPVANKIGGAQARKAFNGELREVAPSLGPIGGGVGSIYDFMGSN